MTAKNITYDEWLKLTQEERERTQRSWNPYVGEGCDVASEAARRLQESSSLPIVAVRIGIFHGGIHILNPELWPKDFHLAPPWFAERFDGFLVGYIEHHPTNEPECERSP